MVRFSTQVRQGFLQRGVSPPQTRAIGSTFEHSFPLPKPANPGPSAPWNRKATKRSDGRARAESLEVQAEGAETCALREAEARIDAEQGRADSAEARIREPGEENQRLRGG